MTIQGISLGVIVFLSGCMGTLSKEECLSGNWQAIGYDDGVAGRYPSIITEHQKSCEETGVMPDVQAWEAGRQRGLVQYCTEANARDLGEKGRSMNRVCPAERTERLQSINADGRRAYQRKRQLIENKRELAKYEAEMDKLRAGETLHLKTEAEARAYMLRLIEKIDALRQKIHDSTLAET